MSPGGGEQGLRLSARTVGSGLRRHEPLRGAPRCPSFQGPTPRRAFQSNLEQPLQKRALINPAPVSKQPGAAPQGRLCVWSGCPGSGRPPQRWLWVQACEVCTTLLQGQVKANLGCAPRRLPP